MARIMYLMPGPILWTPTESPFGFLTGTPTSAHQTPAPGFLPRPPLHLSKWQTACFPLLGPKSCAILASSLSHSSSLIQQQICQPEIQHMSKIQSFSPPLLIFLWSRPPLYFTFFILVTCQPVFLSLPCPLRQSESRGHTDTAWVFPVMACETLDYLACSFSAHSLPLDCSHGSIPVLRAHRACPLNLAVFASFDPSGQNSLLLGFPVVSLPTVCSGVTLSPFLTALTLHSKTTTTITAPQALSVLSHPALF